MLDWLQLAYNCSIKHISKVQHIITCSKYEIRQFADSVVSSFLVHLGDSLWFASVHFTGKQYGLEDLNFTFGQEL